MIKKDVLKSAIAFLGNTEIAFFWRALTLLKQHSMNTQKAKTAVLAAFSTILFAAFTSCHKTGNSPVTATDSLRIVYGYDSVSQIGRDSLVAYFPFNGSFTEVKQNLAGVNTNASFGSAGINASTGQ